MPKYIVVGKGIRVHIICDCDKTTLCGLSLKYDGYARYIGEQDRGLKTCGKCHDIILSNVNA